MVWYFFCTVPPPPKLGFAASPLWPPPPLPLDFNMANSPMQPLHCAHQCVFRRSGFHNSLWETTRPFQCRTASRFCSLPTVVQINKHITSQSATGTTAQALLENAIVRVRASCSPPSNRQGAVCTPTPAYRHPPACMQSNSPPCKIRRSLWSSPQSGCLAFTPFPVIPGRPSSCCTPSPTPYC